MAHRVARRTYSIILASLLSVILSGCIATKVVTTTVGVATKAAVVTVKTSGKVVKGAASLAIPNGEEDGDVEDEEGSE